MAQIEFNMYQTLAIAVVMVFIGILLSNKINFLAKFCIPASVIGGLLFAIFTCICYGCGIVEFSFDDTLKEVCMVFFFTSVGFQANMKVLKMDGIALILLIVVVIILTFAQNFISIGLARVLGVSDYVGLCTGSIPMVGGHGTSGAFGPVLEDFGVTGATTICTAAATFGLIAGSLMGGPLGRGLKKNLVITVGIGTIISQLFTQAGLTFPVYIGGLITGVVVRNVAEYSGLFKVHMPETENFGGTCLSLFLGMAMITLKIWQLADLALHMILLLAAQTVFMFIFARLVVIN